MRIDRDDFFFMFTVAAITIIFVTFIATEYVREQKERYSTETYDGHRYIVLRENDGISMTHSPDCECHRRGCEQ